MNTEDNKNFHTEFGKLLAQKYSRLVPDQDSPYDVGYERAQGLGRYLRAARLNSGMSIHEVASKARMSSVEVAALEQGLLHPDEIDSPEVWLSSLAKVLDDDVEDYYLLLGLRSINKPAVSSSERKSVVSMLRSLLSRGGVPFIGFPSPRTVLVIATLFVFLLAGVSIYRWESVPLREATEEVLLSEVLARIERQQEIVIIARRFSVDQDEKAAQAALEDLGLVNPQQFVLTLAESYIAQYQELGEIGFGYGRSGVLPSPVNASDSVNERLIGMYAEYVNNLVDNQTCCIWIGYSADANDARIIFVDDASTSMNSTTTYSIPLRIVLTNRDTVAFDAIRSIGLHEDSQTIVDLINLAKALGSISPEAEDFLARYRQTLDSHEVVVAPTSYAVPITATPTNTPETTLYVVVEGGPAGVQIAANTPPATPSPPKAVIGGDGQVNVRSGPGTTYPEIAQVSTGTELEIIDQNAAGDWYQVCCVNGEPAWVVARLVEVTGDPALIQVAVAIPAPAASITPTVELGPLVVAKSQASLWQRPGTQYRVVGSIAADEQAEVLGRNAEGTWWNVALADGTEGWVDASLVTTNKVIEGVAIAQNIPPPAQYPWTYTGTAIGAPQCGTVKFSGRVQYANGSPQNGVCVLIDYYGPRMIKFSGSGGAGDGNWSFTPCGDGICLGPIKIYIVECPADGVPDGGLTLEGSGDFPAKSDLFTANITDKCTQGQWRNITFKGSQ